ncbi:hypothetical protein PR048_009591 [Dryococelus australis]|uniref:Cytosolic endo-beta-N-acetylglucosaminidase TIM barrel domain-containing protein n=1 Tax=Dryococelus australis TaxID=614101 RepID=A0ABQ9I0D1_9NEOP|nr:hypothetical protein PR048_009591 [Dryococelus australis]
MPWRPDVPADTEDYSSSSLRGMWDSRRAHTCCIRDSSSDLRVTVVHDVTAANYLQKRGAFDAVHCLLPRPFAHCSEGPAPTRCSSACSVGDEKSSAVWSAGPPTPTLAPSKSEFGNWRGESCCRVSHCMCSGTVKAGIGHRQHDPELQQESAHQFRHHLWRCLCYYSWGKQGSVLKFEACCATRWKVLTQYVARGRGGVGKCCSPYLFLLTPMDRPLSTGIIACRHCVLDPSLEDLLSAESLLLGFVNGSTKHDEYRFFHWAGIDTFVYFSHHFITIPPPVWVNAAHLHGVKILGKFAEL